MDVVGNKKFPTGMRVLAVDDDRICLRIIQKLLQCADYDVTAVLEPEVALEMLRARKQLGNQFDLVITDVHMPGMDGFKLLELITMEMDIPVIMLSANDEPESMLKGITHGASGYLVKPIRLEQVKSLWTHVVKKGINGGNGDAGQKLQPGVADGEIKCAKKTRKYSKKNKDGHGAEVGNANTSTPKRQRIQWSGELHSRFVEVVNRLGGLDRAVPKKILKMMNVRGLGRENVASHLQKYRIYLKKVSSGTFKISNPFANEARLNKWSQINLKNGPESYTRKPEQAALAFYDSPNSSSNQFACMNSTSAFGTRSSLLPTESVQLTSAKRNLVIAENDMGQVGQGGSILKDAAAPGPQPSQFITFANSHINMSGGSKIIHFGPSGTSIANSPDGTEFINTGKSSASAGSSGFLLGNISNSNPPQVRGNGLSSYADILLEKLANAYRGSALDEDDLKIIADDDVVGYMSLVPQPSPELASQYSVQILPSSANLFDKIATGPHQFARLSINTNNGEAVVPPKVDGLGHNGGTFEGLSQCDYITFDQFLERLAISRKIPNFGSEFQNQMDTNMSEEAAPMAGFNYQPMPPANLGSNTNSIVAPNDNCAAGSSSNIIYTVTNGEGASGNLPVNESTVADEPNNINEPLVAAGEAHEMINELLDNDFFIDFNDDFFTTNNAFMDEDLKLDP
ncbi:hypothetical protein QOZ80_8AG0624400 [Eleusine coracana subsp. coracana]|nr:hypothetical protein QOZ80_8AG0624400 [Eleusine coracana subsp. coracana]